MIFIYFSLQLKNIVHLISKHAMKNFALYIIIILLVLCSKDSSKIIDEETGKGCSLSVGLSAQLS